MISNSQKIQDFRQQYKSTYLKRNTKDQEVVYIHTILDDGFVQIVNLKNNTTAIIDSYDNQGSLDYTREFNLEAPKAGIYSANGDVLFLKRTAKRQWVKGLGENNYTLISISKQRPVQFSGNIAQDLFSPKSSENQSLAPLIHTLNKDQGAKKLSDQFSCCPSFNNELWFFFYDLPIAKLKNKDTCLLFCPHYHQELSDLFRANNLNSIRIDHV